MPLVLNGATSGATTLQSTDATTQTITLPANSGTVITTASTFAGTGPAFSAYQSSAQSISNATWTKVQFQTEEFDTASCFDNATNYRFTPNMAGYYQVNLAVQGTAADITVSSIYKNGSSFKEGNWIPGQTRSVASALIYFNGTNDYIEGYVYKSATSNLQAINSGTFFQASLVRAA